MNHPVVSQNGRDWARVTVLSLCAGVGLIAPLSGYPITLAAGALILLAYTLFAVMSLREPLIFVVVFLLVLEVLPPFYFSQTGERPIYLSIFLLPIAFAIVLLRFPDIRFSWDPIAIGLALFLGGTVLSIPFAFWLSGSASAMEGLWRWVLVSQAALTYYLIRGCANCIGFLHFRSWPGRTRCVFAEHVGKPGGRPAGFHGCDAPR